MTLTKSDLTGIFPAFPTPTDAEGRVKAPSLAKLADFLIEGGVRGLVPIGGTGEYPALTPTERRRVVETVVEAARGRVPVIPGVLSPGFGEAVEAGRSFAAAGARAVMLLVPFYVTPTQAGIMDYFRAYRDKVDLPILLYDIPYRTKVVTDPETIATLASEGVIIGMKACNPDIAHFGRILALAGGTMGVLSGEDGLLPVEIAMGAPGAVLATASMIPRDWVEIFELARSGQLPLALERHRRLQPLLDAIFAECNPGPLKEAMNLIGLDVGHVLLPLKRPSEATMANVRQALDTLRQQGILPRRDAAA